MRLTITLTIMHWYTLKIPFLKKDFTILLIYKPYIGLLVRFDGTKRIIDVLFATTKAHANKSKMHVLKANV